MFLFKRISLFIFFSLLLHIAKAQTAPIDVTQINTSLKDSQNIALIPNNGQIKDMNGFPAPYVLFKAVAGNLQVYITTHGITYVMNKVDKNSNILNRTAHTVTANNAKLYRIDADLVNASISKQNVELVERAGNDYNNYFYPNCPNGISKVYKYKKIKIKDVYPGIDWVISFTAQGLKYNFEVATHANPALINIKYKGAESLSLDEKNDLTFGCKLGSITEMAPISYQNGRPIKTTFKLDSNLLTFNMNGYKDYYPFVIDPQLVWGTFFGGSGYDQLGSITEDVYGHLFGTGASTSIDFPVKAGVYYDYTLNGFQDMVIVKFNTDYSLAWSTFYGGSGSEYGTAIKSDKSGNIYVLGNTNSTDFPLLNTGNFFNGTLNKGFNNYDNDFVLLKFDNNCTRIFSTYISGESDDYATDMTISDNNDLFLTGYTFSTGFPVQAGTGYNSANNSGGQDAIIMEFTLNAQLLWSSYIGGSSDEYSGDISVDHSGNIFLTGSTFSSDFPVKSNGTYFNGTLSGQDFYICKFLSNQTMVWSTFYGGTYNEFNATSAVDDNGNLILGGVSYSADLPTYATGNMYIKSSIGIDKADYCFLKFDNNGNRLWATYYGGSGAEGSSAYSNRDIVVDKCGNFYASLLTQSTDIPTPNPGCDTYVDGNLTGGSDCFIVKFSRASTLQWGTYIGNNSMIEGGLDLCLDTKGDLLASGYCDESFGFPFTQYGNAYYDNYDGYFFGSNTYFLKFDQPVFSAGATYEKCTSSGCNGKANIVLQKSCSSAFKYNWSNGLTSDSATGLCSGSYSVTVSDTNNCHIDTVAFTLSKGMQIYPQYTPVSCSFACSGQATAYVPGVGNATYLWSNGKTTETVKGLCPGNYTVTVSAAGCGSSTASFKITIPPILTILINEVDDGTATCGLCDGGAQLVIEGGETGVANVSWSNGDKGTQVNNLCYGDTYVVTANDSACYSTQVNVIVPNPYPFQTGVATGYACAICNGIAIPTIFGGKPPYGYYWSTGDSSSVLSNLCPGNYALTITSGCGTDSLQFQITKAPPVKILYITTGYPSCPDSCNAFLTPTLNWGFSIEPYQYLWSNGATTDTLFNVCVDSTFSLTVTDACGNVAVRSAKVGPFSPLAVGVGVSIYTCPGDCNGIAEAQAQGGIPPYHYTWSGTSNGPIAYFLCPDSSYSLTVTDACSDKIVQNYIFPRASALVLNTGESPSCTESCNGTAYSYLYGGISPYHYLWNTTETTSLILNVCSDSTYYITVTDACGTTSTNHVFIPTAPPVSATISHPASTCPESCNGVATISTSGGTPPFIYIWSNKDDSIVGTHLCADSNYFVIVLDPGCSIDTFRFTIPANQVHASITMPDSISCYHLCDARLSAQTKGGSSPFEYQWSNGGSTAIINNLCAGTYSVTINNPGCSVDSAKVTLKAPSAMSAYVDSIATVICRYDCNGSAVVHISGGIPPFNTKWSNGDTLTHVFALCAGIDYVIVTDPGCSADTIPLIVPSYSQLQLSALQKTDDNCFAECNGFAAVSVQSGVMPYKFLWSNGKTTTAITNLCTGIYYLTVTDSLNCIMKDTSIISQPDKLTYEDSVARSHCFNPDGAIKSVLINGGVLPYSYLWNTGSTTENISGLVPGTYIIAVIDSHSCVLRDTISFTGTYPVLTAGTDTMILIGNQAKINVSGANYYYWSPAYNINCDTCANALVSPTLTTTYCVLGIDTFGCRDTACVTILVSHDCGEAVLPTAFSPNGDGHNDVFRVLGRCITTIHLSIYNRWGEKVFETSDKNEGWDGTYNGKEAEIGVYSYQLEANNLLGDHIYKKGNVTLLR